MTLVDANVLLYAYDLRSLHHDRCRTWLEAAFSGPAPVRIAWVTILAFLRITTSPRAFPRPFTVSEAESIVSSWLALPTVAPLEPGERYWAILGKLLVDAQVSGPLVMDAALAALAIEHGAVLCTTDADFRRFPGLRTIDPTSR
ncbi:MAG TPA: TA system VapC family ribonuclease toxin [Thermodesulfobacteriota bacterium]